MVESERLTPYWKGVIDGMGSEGRIAAALVERGFYVDDLGHCNYCLVYELSPTRRLVINAAEEEDTVLPKASGEAQLGIYDTSKDEEYITSWTGKTWELPALVDLIFAAGKHP